MPNSPHGWETHFALLKVFSVDAVLDAVVTGSTWLLKNFTITSGAFSGY